MWSTRQNRLASSVGLEKPTSISSNNEGEVFVLSKKPRSVSKLGDRWGRVIPVLLPAAGEHLASIRTDIFKYYICSRKSLARWVGGIGRESMASKMKYTPAAWLARELSSSRYGKLHGGGQRSRSRISVECECRGTDVASTHDLPPQSSAFHPLYQGIWLQQACEPW